ETASRVRNCIIWSNTIIERAKNCRRFDLAACGECRLCTLAPQTTESRNVRLLPAFAFLRARFLRAAGGRQRSSRVRYRPADRFHCSWAVAASRGGPRTREMRTGKPGFPGHYSRDVELHNLGIADPARVCQ